MKHILTYLFLIGLLSWTSCRQEASKIIMLVDTEHGQEALPGEAMLFDVHAFANEGAVERVQITSFDAHNGTTSLLDSLVHAVDCRFDFAYTTPLYEDTTELQLSFNAISTDGSSAKAVRRFRVSADNPVLEALDAFTLFSAHSGKPDAFMIDLGQTVYLETSRDSCVDIYDMAGPVPNTLLREWRSGTGLSFARFNDFNFEGATKQHVSSAYAVASKYDKVTELSNNDIILVGRHDTAWGVIKILSVYDEAGKDNDRYTFSLKRLQR